MNNDNKNKVTLIGFYGGDKTHALSAWQSTNVELGIELPEDIQRRIDVLYEATIQGKKKAMSELLGTLAEHGHHTPFEKSTLHFQLSAEIASHIQCLKHRIGISINGESARYKELVDKWYIPYDWKDIPVDINNYSDISSKDFFDYYPGPGSWGGVLDDFNRLAHSLYHTAVEQLTPVLGRKRAKESARYFLPYSKQLDYDMMFNFRSFMHFQSLRNSPHAQVEIQEIAQQMVDQVKSIPNNPFKYSLLAFGYGDE